MIAKAGLGIIGLSAISVGGVALNSPWLLGMDYMPEFHTLDKDNGFSTSYSGKYGEKYGKYLTGVTNQGKADGEKHKSWWEWAYRRLSKVDGRVGKFSDVERGYAEDNDQRKEKALNQICKDAYGKQDSDFHTGNENDKGDKFTKEEVWKYCSIGGTQPQTLTEFNTGKNNRDDGKEEYTDKIGSETDKQSKLLSIDSENNKWIWDLKDKEFKSTSMNEDSFFKTRKEKNIKEVCKEAYGKTENSTSGPEKLTKDDTVKYCSLEGK